MLTFLPSATTLFSPFTKYVRLLVALKQSNITTGLEDVRLFDEEALNIRKALVYVCITLQV